MTDNEIIKAMEWCSGWGKTCGKCPYKGIAFCANTVKHDALDLIKRQQAEIEELNELYTNLKNATVQHSIDNEKDRQLLGEYQNIFLDLGYALEEVSDPELKEIKAWKDRMLWHCKRADKLFTENNELKAEIERLKTENERVKTKTYKMAIDKALAEKARAEAIKEFAEEVKAISRPFPLYEDHTVRSITEKEIDNLVKEMG